MLIKNRHKSSENDQVELAARSTNLLAVCVCWTRHYISWITRRPYDVRTTTSLL